jgi:hypothetical protein
MPPFNLLREYFDPMRITVAAKLNNTTLILALLVSGCGQINSGQPVGPGAGTAPKKSQGPISGATDDTTQDQNQQRSNELLPPTADIPAIRPVPNATVVYDFVGTLSRDSRTAAVSRMILQNPQLKSAKKVKVSGTLVNLRASSQKQPIDREVDVLPGGVVDFTIQNLKPDTVYRIDGVSITDVSQANQSSASTKMKDPYFLATANDSKLSKARRRLALEALNEAYDWDNRNYDSSKQYARGWGWCDYFYTWMTARQFSVRPGSASTSFFRQYNALAEAERIPKLSETESVAGDLIRLTGHTFMIIAYDVDTQSLWNVEGNYNSRVMRSQRKIRSEWMHGHLTEAQVK